MFFFGIIFIKGALRKRKELYYPKACLIADLGQGIAFIIWAIVMIILEFI